MSNDPLNPPRPPRGFKPGSDPLPEAFEQIYLDRVKVAAQGHVTRAALADRAVAFQMIDMLADSMIVQMETTVLGHNRRSIEWQLVEYRPDGWWQYLKRRHAPRWILRRWPVKLLRHERTLRLPMRTLYPEHPVPGGLGPVVFHALDVPAFEMEGGRA